VCPHFLRLSQADSQIYFAWRLHQLRQTEVQDFQPAVRRETQIPRFEIAVNHPLLVGRGQAFR